MISTKELKSLPDRHRLKQLCKSISVLDAIFSEDWLDRYYSFQSKWSITEEFCEMRNGQGDNVLILFHSNGCVINGMIHEYYPKDKSKLTEGLPDIFNEFIFGEPVNSIGTTFCIWADNNSKWKIGNVEDFEDGSQEVLYIFNGIPQTYIDWAAYYFEIDWKDKDKVNETVSMIYKGFPLTNEMVYTLNNNFNHLKQLIEDLKEIEYPYALR